MRPARRLELRAHPRAARSSPRNGFVSSSRPSVVGSPVARVDDASGPKRSSRRRIESSSVSQSPPGRSTRPTEPAKRRSPEKSCRRRRTRRGRPSGRGRRRRRSRARRPRPCRRPRRGAPARAGGTRRPPRGPTRRGARPPRPPAPTPRRPSPSASAATPSMWSTSVCVTRIPATRLASSWSSRQERRRVAAGVDDGDLVCLLGGGEEVRVRAVAAQDDATDRERHAPRV